MTWMEHGLQTSLNSYTLSMEDKLRLELLEALGIMDETAPLTSSAVCSPENKETQIEF